MKLAKKFVSLAAALAMGTCVYTVPVFADGEEPPLPANTTETPQTEEPDTPDAYTEPAVINETDSASGSSTTTTQNPSSTGSSGSSSSSNSSSSELCKASEYVTYEQDPFKYDEETETLTVELTIKDTLPSDLIYELSWLAGERMPSLTIEKATFNGKDVDYTTGDLTTATVASTGETAQVEVAEEAETEASREGFKIKFPIAAPSPAVNVQYAKGKKNILSLTFDVDGIETNKPLTRLLDLQSKVYIDGHDTDNEAIVRNQKVSLGDLETYKYSSAYDQATNRFTLNVQVPEKVFAGDEDLYMMIGAAPDGSLLESLQSIKIGNQAISEGVFKTFVKDTITIPGLKDITLPDGLKMYRIQIPYSQLNNNMSTTNDEITFVFNTKKDAANSMVYAYASTNSLKGKELYTATVKDEVGDTTNVTFKGSHDYDSTKQTWTVNLAMTGRPDKLDLTFTQTEGTALGKPTSITVDGTAVSPTVNTQMSGSTMSVCTVDFRKEDLDKIKADSKVTLVFPIDGSTEQSERILMNVDLGNSSKDLSAKFTVKKSSTSPSSSSNVHTATESGMSTMLVVAAVALAAFALFGVLAFKKKKSK